jgi:hypothetical protein
VIAQGTSTDYDWPIVVHRQKQANLSPVNLQRMNRARRQTYFGKMIYDLTVTEVNDN